MFQLEKVHFRSQTLEHTSIEYWNISGVSVLPENMIFMLLEWKFICVGNKSNWII